MQDSIKVKVDNLHQIKLPGQLRAALNIEAGDRLLMAAHGGTLILLPEPDDYVRYMAGLYGDVWQDVDVAAYLDEERGAWD